MAVALSGGADSVALVWLLHEVDALGDWPAGIAGLIHVNHGLRGDESARDEAFCRSLAERLTLPIEVAHADVAREARAAGLSIEAAGRATRYRFFAEAAARLDASIVATAHTLDDQAETVLLRLLRGAGSRGLSGIRRQRGPFIRPLLDCRRADLRHYLADRGETYCEDSSNDDIAFVRNRIRHRLLPVIEQISPAGIVALARFAALSADDETYLEQAAAEAAPAVVLSGSNGVQLDVEALAMLPPAIGRRVVRLAAERAVPSEAFGAAHLEAVMQLAGGDRPAGSVDLPGLKVLRRGPTLFLGVPRPRSGQGPETLGVSFERPLAVPGSVEVPEAGITLASELVTMKPTRDMEFLHELHGDQTGDVAVLQATSFTVPLVVRSRRPGDRLRPLGAPGHRKLQDLLVDRKVPRDERDRVPIVVDAAGQIVWVVGHSIAEECRVTAPETGMVILKARRIR